MNTFVIDASIAAKWLLDEVHSEAARRVLAAGNRLHAPDFLLLEMDSVLLKRARRAELGADDAADARALLRRLPVEYHRFTTFQDGAWEIAGLTQCSIYDCVYLALAAILDAPMVTADRRLCDRLAGGPLAARLLWVEEVGGRQA